MVCLVLGSSPNVSVCHKSVPGKNFCCNGWILFKFGTKYSRNIEGVSSITFMHVSCAEPPQITPPKSKPEVPKRANPFLVVRLQNLSAHAWAYANTSLYPIVLCNKEDIKDGDAHVHWRQRCVLLRDVLYLLMSLTVYCIDAACWQHAHCLFFDIILNRSKPSCRAKQCGSWHRVHCVFPMDSASIGNTQCTRCRQNTRNTL